MASLCREDWARLSRILARSSNKYPLKSEHYPKEVFPLFLTSMQYLQMVDGTLKKPFLPRKADGCVEESKSIFGQHDSDGIDLLAILEETYEEDDSSDETEQNNNLCLKKSTARMRTHMSYKVMPFR